MLMIEGRTVQATFLCTLWSQDVGPCKYAETINGTDITADKIAARSQVLKSIYGNPNSYTLDI